MIPDLKSVLALLYVPLSYCFFYIFNKIVSSNTVPKSCTKPLTWANILTSFTHSLITGSGGMLVLYLNPGSTSKFTYGTDVTGLSMYFSIITAGYFIYDLIDMVNDTNSKFDYSLFVHHAACITCFSLSVIYPIYRIYAMGALLHEVQSVFLHFRRLCNLAKVDRKSQLYQTAKYLNFISFLIFRFLVNYIMLKETWLLGDTSFFKGGALVGAAVNVLFILLNLDVFWKILKSDFMASGKQVKKWQ